MPENTAGDSDPEEDSATDQDEAQPDGGVSAEDAGSFSEESGESEPSENEDGGKPDGPDELIDEISDSLADEGFGVFHGREFISIRENGQLAPNSTVSKQYLDGKKAVILAYNEDTNEIAIIPLDTDYDRTNVYSLQWSDDRVSISASGFLKDNGIQTEQTIRYPPEWNEDIGSEQVPGGLMIDLDQDGEVAPAAHDEADEDADEINA
ncbi:hypothetical protein [Halosimplex pelagicum]|uniref:Uncharacterized protein n=1 Tax=Halosimplex pelagicum TaxID=869886 RepID=A0A7D5P6U3_9EURY|nr:hypothetical protein [Halosimplex pelagicum]QLH82183.1 hypothetical protein HZS54_11455 [Halosimplex pelagicum]